VRFVREARIIVFSRELRLGEPRSNAYILLELGLKDAFFFHPRDKQHLTAQRGSDAFSRRNGPKTKNFANTTNLPRFEGDQPPGLKNVYLIIVLYVIQLNGTFHASR